MDDIKLAGKKQNLDPMWNLLNKEVDLGEPTSFLDHVYLACTQRQCEISKDIVDNYRTMFESRIFARSTEKLPCSENLSISSGSSDMEGHAKKCVERYCELANKTTQQLYKVSTHDLMTITSKKKNWNPWENHHTCEYKQYCYVGNTAKQCRLGLFQDSDFAGDLEDSKSTSGATLCFFGSHTFVPISWMCKKQTSVSHSSTELDIISLDAGLRMDGKPAFDLWDLIVAVLLGNTNQSNQERWDLSTSPTRKKIPGKIDDLNNVDFVSSNVHSSRKEALLHIFEDNEAVIKMIIKGRSPTMRHVSRTHRVALDWSFDRINWDPKIQIKYIDTKNNSQTYWQREISHVMSGTIFLCLFSISHYSSINSAKRDVEKNARRCKWRKSHSKIKADDEFGIEMPCKGSDRACLDCIWKPGEHQIWKSERTSEPVRCAANKYGETRIGH